MTRRTTTVQDYLDDARTKPSKFQCLRWSMGELRPRLEALVEAAEKGGHGDPPEAEVDALLAAHTSNPPIEQKCRVWLHCHQEHDPAIIFTKAYIARAMKVRRDLYEVEKQKAKSHLDVAEAFYALGRAWLGPPKEPEPEEWCNYCRMPIPLISCDCGLEVCKECVRKHDANCIACKS